MYDYYQLFHYVNQMNQYLRHQHERLRKLEDTILRMEEELQELKERPVTNIENLEYKFDQLKVETLEGTLNIGLTPHGPDGIDQFDVNQSQVQTPVIEKEYPGLYPGIRDDIHKHLDTECYGLLEKLEEKRGIQLDTPYRKFMIEDVKRQIDDRIRYYLSQINEGDIPEEQVEAMRQEVISKVKQDIERSFEVFLEHMPGKEMNDKQ